jgi:hypothetical protein
MNVGIGQSTNVVNNLVWKLQVVGSGSLWMIVKFAKRLLNQPVKSLTNGIMNDAAHVLNVMSIVGVTAAISIVQCVIMWHHVKLQQGYNE